MTWLHTFLDTVWLSLNALGWINVVLIVIVIALISRAQSLLGTLAALLFIAFLAHWI